MSSIAARHGGHILLESLYNLGARHGFGVPGESYLAALDAMADSQFDFTLCRNEGGAAFMAAAYGKLTGSPGICFVTRGPGATNASIGVHTALQDSSPMLLFIGQVGTDMIGREAFQEVDYRAMFSPLAKWVTQIDECARIPELVSHAWSKALSGRPGPVVIALPENMLSSLSDVQASGKAIIPKPAPSQSQLDEIMKAIQSAQKPVIIAGGGGWDEAGKQALKEFAEHLSIPVAAAFRYHDVIDNHSPAFIGDAGVAMTGAMKSALQEADLIVALNIRFGEMVTQGWSLFDLPKMKQKLIHCHLSADEIGKIYQPDIALVACPNEVANQLVKMATSATPNPEHVKLCADYHKNYQANLEPPEQNTKLDLASVIRHIEAVTPDDAIITHGAGNFAIWPDKFMRFGTRRLLAPQSGAMGYGLPAAIAAHKACQGTKKIICFAGDGDIQMNLSELGTAMQHGAKPIILIYNNGSYGTIRMHQEKHYPKRISGTELENPDFIKLASAYGFDGYHIHETDEFGAAFDKALIADRGVIIELMQDIEAISPRATITSLRQG